MDLFKFKKPLAILLAITMVGAILPMAISGIIGQQHPQQYRGGAQYTAMAQGAYAIPGIPSINLGPGTNTVALSVSIASRQGSQIYFQVNSFAVVDPQTQTATVYQLSQAVPGIIDTSTNNVQIDIAQLQSSIQSTSQASMSDLYNILRPTVNTLMVVAQIALQSQTDTQATFQIQNVNVIMPDGQTNAFNLGQPMTAVVDSSAMRIFTVGFPQMYSLINTYITNVQLNYYTQVNYNIITGPTIVVTPPIVTPVLTPITFPTVWPIYFPVPVPVPIPVVTVTPPPPSVTPPPPSVSPTVSPTASPTASPKASPTASPKASPSVSPTASPTASPKASPTASPKASPTMKPTASPVVSPKASPTTKPTVTLKISPTAKPTGSLKPLISPKPTKPIVVTGAPVASLIAASPKPSPKTTLKPTPGGGGPIPTPKPITTVKPTPGGGGPIPTPKPITTVKPTPGGGGGKPTATKKP